MESKRLMLFIVEGSTDMISLEGVLTDIFSNDEVEFEIMHGDVTATDKAGPNAIADALARRIDDYLKLYYIDKSEVKLVVHLVDTDGAFIPQSKVEKGNNEHIRYMENRIITKHTEQIILRNAEKNRSIRSLVKLNSINGIPYRIFYFSRNLEHVLHNQQGNIGSREKCKLAYRFAAMYKNRAEDFVSFICNEEVAVHEGYEGSWAFIFSRCNSLKRYTNLNVLLEDEDIVLRGN